MSAFRFACVVALAAGLSAVGRADDDALTPYQRIEPHMGTKFILTVYAESQQQASAAIEAASRRIAEIEQRMSDYRPDSEIRQLARQAPTREPLPISADLREVLAASRRIGAATDGAFDITVGRLSELWRGARSSNQLPDPRQTAEALKGVGLQRWRLSEGGVELLQRDMRLDLGGIAKGYALDEALQAMRDAGVGQALINGGGDIVAGDAPPGRDAWRVAVASLEADGEPRWTVPLVNGSVCTSGDAWQHVEIDGRRYSHLLDPKTGRGVEGRHAATVVAPTAMAADAWASALCVLGPAGLKAIAVEKDTAAVITVVEQGKPRQAWNPRFKTIAQPAEDPR